MYEAFGTTLPRGPRIDDVIAKSSRERNLDFRRVARLTLPENADAPTERLKFRDVSDVAIAVPVELLRPKICSGLRHRRLPATFVSMPEAAVDEHDGAVPWEDEVRRPGQIATMQTEPKPLRVRNTPHDQFRSRVLLPDRSHMGAARLLIEDVGHQPRAGLAACAMQ